MASQSTALATTAPGTLSPVQSPDFNGSRTEQTGQAADFIQNTKSKFNALPKRNKTAIAIGIPLLLAFLISVGMWSNSVEYQPLYNQVSEQDGGQIVEELKRLQIPYELSQSNGVIMIPKDQIHETRLALANIGLPKGSVIGFEAMDNQKMGVTQFQEQVNFQRGLEGELVRSIQSIEAVNSARVHLAIPKPSIFIREEQEPSASVFLNLAKGATLTKSQIQGIVNLVASSLPNLSSERITVVDQTGRLLSSREGLDSGLDATQITYTRTIESDLNARILEILTPLFGRDNVKATVTAKLNFNKVQTTEETFKPNQNPGEASIRSQQTNVNINGGTLNPQGVPGVLTNTPPVEGTAEIGRNPQEIQQPGAGNPNSSSNNSATTNYELDRKTTQAQLEVGQVDRLSAAVIVNYKEIVNEKGETRQVPLTPDELFQVQVLAKQAVGFNADRGDSLDVVNQQFNQEDFQVAVGPTDWVETSKSYALPLAIALAAAILVFGLLRPMLVKQRNDDGPELIPGVANLEQIPEMTIEQQESVLLEKIAGNKNPTEDELHKIRMLSTDNPELFASILKDWMMGKDLVMQAPEPKQIGNG